VKLGVGVGETVELEVEEGVFVQLGAKVRPGVMQAEGQGQSVQFNEPAVEKVPMGQSMALVEERGQ